MIERTWDGRPSVWVEIGESGQTRIACIPDVLEVTEETLLYVNGVLYLRGTDWKLEGEAIVWEGPFALEKGDVMTLTPLDVK